MPPISREEILRRLRKNIAEGRPIISIGAGTGISAKFEESGGTDLLIVYNSGATAWRGAAPARACSPTAMQMPL